MTNSSSKAPAPPLSPARSIRLHNKVRGNLSLHLGVLRWPAAGSLRRAMALTPISIAQGGYYDVCAQLGVSYEEACAIVARSPEVQAFKRSAYLDEYHFPPPPEETEETSHVVATEAPGSAAETVVSAASTPESAPTTTALPATSNPGAGDVAVAASPPVELPAIVTAPPADERDGEPEPGFRLPPPKVGAANGALDEPAEPTNREPSMDWTEDALRTYAARIGVDVSKAKSKTAVLRAVRTEQPR